MKTRVVVTGVLAALATATAHTSGQLLRADFESGSRDGWYLTSGGGAAVADDTGGIGSGKALFVTVSGGSTQRRLVANFDPVDLASVGDSAVLRFDFRITGSRGTNADGGFRFGLFDSQGTRVTNDGSSGASSGNASNNVGYLAMVSVGTRTRARLVEETGEDPHFMGGPDLRVLTTDDNFGGIDDALKHTAVFTIRRVSTAALEVDLAIDGRKSISTVVSGDLRTRFDVVGFAGTNSSCNFAIDNVEVTSEGGRSTQAPPVIGGPTTASEDIRNSRIASSSASSWLNVGKMTGR